MSFLDDIKKEQHYTLTENGALALDSTSNALVDLFAVSGALRFRDEEEIEMMFGRAMVEDKLLATKMAFYTRDIRGGLGERDTGRIMLRYLARYYPDIFKKNVELISEYGRWDDLIYLLVDARDVIIPILKKQLDEDLLNMKEGKSVSLLAKWMPSVNTSNTDQVQRGRYLAKAFGMSERQYRKMFNNKCRTESKLLKVQKSYARSFSIEQASRVLYKFCSRLRVTGVHKTKRCRNETEQ